MPQSNGNRRSAFATLLAVLIVGMVGSVVVVSLLVLSWARSSDSQSLQRREQARALADSCVERQLNALIVAPAYTGTTSFTLPTGGCVVTVTGAALPKTIEATGSVDNYNQLVRVIVTQIAPTVIIGQWQYLAQF